MGTFIGHLVPGCFFLVVGIWHLWSSCLSFATSPSQFRTRVWHPCLLPGPFRYLELIFIIVGSALDLLFFENLAGVFSTFATEGYQFWMMASFQHISMFSLFLLYATLTLISETTSLLPLPQGGVHLLFSSAFSGELAVFALHFLGHGGLEERIHLLLSLSIAFCVIVSFLSASFPHSFLVGLGMTAVILLQGLWLNQIAFTIYGPLLPSRCTHGGGDIQCASKDDETGALDLLTTYFCLHIAGVLCFTLASYCFIVQLWGSTEFWDRFSHKNGNNKNLDWNELVQS